MPITSREFAVLYIPALRSVIFLWLQTKAKGFDEFAALDEAEKPANGLEKSIATEERLETGIDLLLGICAFSCLVILYVG